MTNETPSILRNGFRGPLLKVKFKESGVMFYKRLLGLY